MITVDKLTYSYTKKPFIKEMSFTVSKGEIFGFLGPSGAGKSTLQKILIGMLPTYQGTAMVNGLSAVSIQIVSMSKLALTLNFLPCTKN